MSENYRPRIHVLATGGTIAGKAADRLDAQNYDYGMVQGADLVERVPELENYAELKVVEVASLGSHETTTSTWLDLLKQIERSLVHGAAGLVVTHGTETLEDTAFFLAAATRTDSPIVMTGSMRPGTALSSDGDMNLLQAVVLAGSNAARRRGVLVTMADRIVSAAYVRKVSGASVEAMGTRNQGFVGGFFGARPHFYFEPSLPVGLPYYDLRGIDSLPSVAIVAMYPGASRSLLDVAISESDGVVLDCPGTGWPPDLIYSVARELAAGGYPISITGSAGISYRRDAFDMGAGLRTARQARIELMLQIATGR